MWGDWDCFVGKHVAKLTVKYCSPGELLMSSWEGIFLGNVLLLKYLVSRPSPYHSSQTGVRLKGSNISCWTVTPEQMGSWFTREFLLSFTPASRSPAALGLCDSRPVTRVRRVPAGLRDSTDTPRPHQGMDGEVYLCLL